MSTKNGYTEFPVWPSHHEPDRCWNCGNIFGEAPVIDSGNPPGHGQFRITCRTCAITTHYDVKPKIRRQHVENCVFCAKFKATDFFPPHDASDRCESGKRNHCTCDTCF